LHSQTTIDAADERFSPDQVKANVARSLLAALESECKSYCVLSGYDRLPESFDTDIDFMVDVDDFARMPHIIEHVAHDTNTKLFHTVEHELSARSYTLGFQSRDKLVIVQPDSTADYRHFGLLWLRAPEVLATRRIHPHGFWIPAPAHEFAYYLIKKLNKRSLNEEQGLKLHRLYLQDPAGCDAMIARFWREPNRSKLSRMAATNNWVKMETGLQSFRTELRRNSEETLWRRTLSIPAHLLHHLARVVKPTGGCIAIMGPDGAGKSAVIDALRHQFDSAYNEIKLFHLRPKALWTGKATTQAVTDPHGKPPRGAIVSVLKVLSLIVDYWLGYALKIGPAVRRSQLIIFDRYIYDLLVDSKRVRYGGPAWLLELAARIVPHTDLVILLDAPADVLWSRKQEVPFEEVMRQRDRYCKVAGKLSFATTINAAQPLADVIHDVEMAIVEYYERRTAARLRLTGPLVKSNHISVEPSRPQC
jgi:thymidylate kinase